MKENKRKEYHRQYYQKNKEIMDARNKQYRQDHKEEIRLYSKIYYKNNKDYFKNHRINNPVPKDKAKEYSHKYINSNKGKKSIRRGNSRRRGMNYVEMFSNPFPEELEVDYHHINDMLVVPLPRTLHRNCRDSNHKLICRNIMSFIYGIDYVELLKEN